MSLLKYIADAYDNKKNKSNIYKIYLNNTCPHAYNIVLNNNFITEKNKKYILDYYIEIKKCYNSFSYVSRLFKWKKYKNFSIDTDLCGTPLNLLSNNQKIKLIQNKTIYTFRLSDLLNIWKNSLTNNNYLNPNPLQPNNPYTNIKFSLSDMVNIFIKTKYTQLTIPIYIDIYWRCLMNMKKFKFQAFNILKEEAIYNYMKNGAISTYFLDIVNMINNLSPYLYNYRISINHTYESKKIIVDTMKPYLKTYLLSFNSSNNLKKSYYYKKNVRELKDFFKKNPTFGRVFFSIPNRNRVNIRSNSFVDSGNNQQQSFIDNSGNQPFIDNSGNQPFIDNSGNQIISNLQYDPEINDTIDDVNDTPDDVNDTNTSDEYPNINNEYSDTNSYETTESDIDSI